MKIYLKFISLFSAIISSILWTGCKKNTDTAPIYQENNLATLSLEFDNIVGDRILSFNNTASPYKNESNETFTISKLQYFISNIIATTNQGVNYKVNPDSSYFLIDGMDKTTRFATVKVPVADYSSITFTVGIDSLRSTLPIDKRVGVLDPAAPSGMYWGWNSGYIFFKLEGNSSAISNDAGGDPSGKQQFKYHIGGFGGYSSATINNIKVVKLNLTAAGIAKVRTERQSNVHVFVDVMRVFNGKNMVSIAAHPNVMFSAYSVNVASNLSEIFKHDHTEN